MHLDDLFDPGLLAEMLNGGYVRTQRHPAVPLVIYNYTERAQYEQVWNPVTLACRGLICDAETGTVVARPFPKFFNHGQAGCATIPLTAAVHVTDKVDGSLGILYPTPDRWAVATRGSFTSDQALHATYVLRHRHTGFEPPAGHTVLVEIVYPENRIVVDYAGLDDLVLLGAVDVATGAVYGPEAVRTWPGPRAQAFECATFADALALPPRSNAEGVVVRDRRTGATVKIKQIDYIELHRIVTGLSARTVWTHLCKGLPLDELIAPLPDEFAGWVRKVADGIETTVRREQRRMEEAYAEVRDRMPPGWTQGDRATRAVFAADVTATVSPADRWAMFHLLDGRDIGPELLRRADPGGDITPAGRAVQEVAA